MRTGRLLIGALLVSVLLAGCRADGQHLVTSPLNFEQQERELLAIAPLGTPRDEVLESLQAAGVEGHFGGRDGAARSIYYCDAWQRPDGDRWFVDVALLFDEEGRLYRIRRGTTDVSAVLDEPDSAAAEATGIIEPASSVPTPRSTARSRDRRLPFVGTDSLQ